MDHVDNENVWYRMAGDRDKWEVFKQNLNELGESEICEDTTLTKGSVVLVSGHNSWRRGQIILSGRFFDTDINDFCQIVKVNLIDYGEIVTVDRKDVKKVVISEEEPFIKHIQILGCKEASRLNWNNILETLPNKKIILVNKGSDCEDLLVEKMGADKSSSFCLPTQKVFKAMLMHIDSCSVVWVIPCENLNLLTTVVAGLGTSMGIVSNVLPGMFGIARSRGRNIRVRVIECMGDDVCRLICIDNGEEFISVATDLHRMSPTLNTIPPLAVPLKLYGVCKKSSKLSVMDTASVLNRKWQQSSLQCTVNVLQNVRNLDLPLPAHVRYSVVDENDGNLAHDMVVSGLCDVMTSHSEWQKEVSDHELDWLLRHPMLTALPCLTFLPHPLPLFVGQWLQISVVVLVF